MKILFLLSFLILASCGAPETEFQGIDPEIQIELNALNARILKYSDEQLISLTPINFKSTSTHVAECHGEQKNGKSAKEIFIDPEFWENNKDDKNAIHIVLMHEIGHCTYNLDHDDGRFEVGPNHYEAKSVMHQYWTYLIITFEPSLERYVKEFFNKTKGVIL